MRTLIVGAALLSGSAVHANGLVEFDLIARDGEAKGEDFGDATLPTSGVVTETYSYDAAGRLIQVGYADGRILSYTYDANSNLLAVDIGLSDSIFADRFEP